MGLSARLVAYPTGHQIFTSADTQTQGTALKHEREGMRLCVVEGMLSLHEISHLQCTGVALLRKERLEVLAVQEGQAGFK